MICLLDVYMPAHTLNVYNSNGRHLEWTDEKMQANKFPLHETRGVGHEQCYMHVSKCWLSIYWLSCGLESSLQ